MNNTETETLVTTSAYSGL